MPYETGSNSGCQFVSRRKSAGETFSKKVIDSEKRTNRMAKVVTRETPAESQRLAMMMSSGRRRKGRLRSDS